MKWMNFVLAISSGLMVTSAIASGEDTYKDVCANCHAKGFANSPQVGDKAKWAPLIAEGQVVLTAHGYVGLRAMPPKGGKADLSVSDFSAALNHMVNLSGGNWKTPDKKTLAAIQAEIAERKKLSAPK